MTTNHMPPQWVYGVLAILNAHGWYTAEWSHQTLRFMNAWATAEGGAAAWNPLNTTLRFMGSTNYNVVGVQNYTKPKYGVIATALTLLNGNYNSLVGSLQAGTLTAEEIVNQHASEISLWGTNPSVLLNVLKGLP